MGDTSVSSTPPNSFPRFSHLKRFLGSSHTENGDYELLLEGSNEYEMEMGNSVTSSASIPFSPAARSVGGGRGRKYGMGPMETVKQYGAVPLFPTNNNPNSVPRQRKISRAMTKRGSSNLTPTNIENDGWPFLADSFTTVLEINWIFTLLTFCFVFIASWLVFAGVWYTIVYIHGDLEPENVADPTWTPCISGMKDFTSAFLFSVETQHTTGYGYYHLTERCAAAVITLCAQSIFGVILEGLMVGLVFVKVSRAKKRSATLMFSRTSVISQRDGKLCFMFRVADMRKSHLLDASVRAQFISKRTTPEGEEITISQEEMEVGGDGEKENKLLLFWPTTIIHRINSSSPLYKLSAADVTPDNPRFEIIVVLEGIVEATGLTTQARSSYMPSEIKWGHRFKNVTSSKSKSGNRVIDYSLFNETVHVPNSPLSAHQIDTLSSIS